MYYLNGTLTSTKPSIALGDFGFARGITVFELFRVYRGRPFRLEAHMDRLFSGAAQLEIEMPFSRKEIEGQALDLIARHGHEHSAVKMYLTAGECGAASGLSLAACKDFKPQLIVGEDAVALKHPQAPYGLEVYQRGQALQTVPNIRELPTVKTANYGIGFVAAKKHGAEADDILFTTAEGFVTEATRANFFAVIDGVLVTAKRGMLEGITRQVVLELAERLGIEVSVEDYTVEKLVRATEAFTCGSIAELVPVRSLNGVVLPGAENRMETPVFARLRQAFSELTEQECPGEAEALAA